MTSGKRQGRELGKGPWWGKVGPWGQGCAGHRFQQRQEGLTLAGEGNRGRRGQAQRGPGCFFPQ